jgi:thiol-disulfide isomerase/thioredoxin
MKKLLLIITLFCINIPFLYSQTVGLDIGNTAPDIRLPNSTGVSVPLSSFKGKVVLIDFWASWCAPCVKEQPELAELYKQYKGSVFNKGKGFEIYGVSLDNKKAEWESSIKKMNLNWIQVSDLKFWTSPVAKTYNIQALPFNVLIDDKGIILAKNLHGDALKQFLKTLLP